MSRRRPVVIAAAGLAVLVASSATARPEPSTVDPSAVCTPEPGWGTPHQELVPRALELVNAHRIAIGLGRLAISPQLSASAVWKARHMAAYGYLEVDDPAPPVRRTFLDRLTACGYSGPIAFENIAQGYPDAESITKAWLDDPESRASIEHQGYTVTGIAAATGANGDLYWVEDFGVAAAPPADARCHVPSVVGKTVTAAKVALRRSGCLLGTVVRVRWRHALRGRVIAQAPQPGRILRRNARVDLVVSRGPRRP